MLVEGEGLNTSGEKEIVVSDSTALILFEMSVHSAS
jgi:hypothetical protein